jgi:D-alanyl-lipoteichoic acid acyltransferase DltB (MBOAT superfamily)
MLFNSLPFVAFFLVVYSLYAVLTHRYQNALLLVASYFFYGSWDWRFLGLMLLSTAMDYGFGLLLGRVQDEARRRVILTTSISVNLGILFVFKYFNFFAVSLDRLLSIFGLHFDVHLLNVILPLGISFYTFHNISYIVDVYRRRVEPARRFVDFGLYVALFPQLIAGPIARPAHLLPQIQRPRRITYEMLRMGGWLILLGYFKKVVLADNMAPFTKQLFENPHSLHGTEVLFGLYAFAFQIYGDFSGYSDIARGLANLMGFELALNFERPYLAVNPADFWRRWHISLSTWLRDYLYIPLGGNREGTARTYRNLLITMLLGGLWHGAAWHYVAWGVFHGVLLCLHRAAAPLLARLSSLRNTLAWRVVSVVVFFHVTCFGWLLFAVKGLPDVPVLLHNLFVPFVIHGRLQLLTLLLFAAPLMLMELVEEWSGKTAIVKSWPRPLRLVSYASLVVVILLCGAFDRHAFIYFQF